MCFSANASFGAGVVISVIGVACMRKVSKPSHLFFASVPLIFAIQQFCEGFLWLTLPYPGHLITQKIMTYGFIFFAKVFWPLWLPMAIIFLEKDDNRRKIQFIWLASGIIVAVYALIGLFTHSAQASIIGHHITYNSDYHNAFRKYSGLFYGAATVAPSFCTHIKRMWIFGATILLSYLVTSVFYGHYVVSVWCFFSSIISISIYFIIINNKSIDSKQAYLTDKQGGKSRIYHIRKTKKGQKPSVSQP